MRDGVGGGGRGTDLLQAGYEKEGNIIFPQIMARLARRHTVLTGQLWDMGFPMLVADLPQASCLLAAAVFPHLSTARQNHKNDATYWCVCYKRGTLLTKNARLFFRR